MIEVKIELVKYKNITILENLSARKRKLEDKLGRRIKYFFERKMLKAVTFLPSETFTSKIRFPEKNSDLFAQCSWTVGRLKASQTVCAWVVWKVSRPFRVNLHYVFEDIQGSEWLSQTLKSLKKPSLFGCRFIIALVHGNGPLLSSNYQVMGIMPQASVNPNTGLFRCNFPSSNARHTLAFQFEPIATSLIIPFLYSAIHQDSAVRAWVPTSFCRKQKG